MIKSITSRITFQTANRMMRATKTKPVLIRKFKGARAKQEGNSEACQRSKTLNSVKRTSHGFVKFTILTKGRKVNCNLP